MVDLLLRLLESLEREGLREHLAFAQDVEEEKIISQGLTESLDPQQVVVRHQDRGIELLRYDLRTLRQSVYLNDEVVNAYLALISSERCGVFAFSTFFFTLLSEHGYSRVRRWTCKFDLFSFRQILVPIHHHEHWMLAVIGPATRTIHFYDSVIGEQPFAEAVLRILLSYLEQEHQDKLSLPLTASDWHCSQRLDHPVQHTSGHCGVYICQFARCLTNPEGGRFDFSDHDMLKLRMQMLVELYRFKLK